MAIFFFTTILDIFHYLTIPRTNFYYEHHPVWRLMSLIIYKKKEALFVKNNFEH